MHHVQLVPGTSQPHQASHPSQHNPMPTTGQPFTDTGQPVQNVWQQAANMWTGIPNQQFGYGTINQQYQEHEDLKKRYTYLERELSLLRNQLTQQSQETQHQSQPVAKAVPASINVRITPPTDEQAKGPRQPKANQTGRVSNIPNLYLKATRPALPKVASPRRPPLPPPMSPLPMQSLASTTRSYSRKQTRPTSSCTNISFTICYQSPLLSTPF